MKTLGADLGGTWLRLCLADTRTGAFLPAKEPAVPWNGLVPVLRRFLRGQGMPDRLVLGSTGIWSAGRRLEAARLLRGLADRVLVLSDIELAQAAAFAGGPGILVVGGTGSIAFGRDLEGGSARAGGLGALLGDEGSGFWIGRQALRDPALRRRLGPRRGLGLVHEPRPAAAIASLAPVVLRLSREDPGFAAIRRDACRALAGLAREVRGSLSFRGQAPVSWRGGLFQDRAFLDEFLRALKSLAGFAPRPALLEAEVAAAILPVPVLQGRA